MKSVCLLIGSLFAIMSLQAQSKRISLDDIYSKATYSVKDVPGFNSMKNENFYSTLESKYTESRELYYNIHIHNLNTKKIVETVFDSRHFSSEILKDFKLETYSFSNDEDWLILYGNGENIYRRSYKYYVFLYHLPSKQLIRLSEEKVLHASISPQGNKVAYVKDNNLFIYNIKQDEHIAITNDGKWNYIINGNCDWVYEEEFGFTKAYEWSPDGAYVAYYKFDESRVREFTMAKYNGLYPEQYVFKYPKAGEENSIVSIHLYDVQNTESTEIPVGKEQDQYIPRIKWANNSELCILQLNRHQNHLNFLFYSTKSNHIKNELQDVNEYYVDIVDPIILAENGQRILFQSERDGYNHIYAYHRPTQQLDQITKGAYDVMHFLGYNAKAKSVYFTAAKSNPTETQLFIQNVTSNSPKALTSDGQWVTVRPFPSMEKFLIRESSFQNVPTTKLVDNKGKVIQVLETNQKLKNTLSQYKWGERKMMVFQSDDPSIALYGYMITPPDFNPNKQYPVLMYQYSGPGSQEVKNTFVTGNYWWHQYLAQEGYIVVCVDGRGTGSRGEAFKKVTYLQLGKYESDDQIAVARQLANMSFVDRNRIGIWGWSYGGYMSAICLMKGHEVFSTAISVAPVSSWRYYDNIYTERFMRTPQENASGYDDNSPVNMVDKLTGNLLIIHGTADDNVHFQNAVMMTNALIKANKQFESFYYPDKDHGIYGGNTRLHLFTKMTNYLKENL